MLNGKKYVPVLRWKRAEWVALRELDNGTRDEICPIVEIPPSRFKPRKGEERANPEERLEEIIEQIGNNWGDQPLFLDLNILPSRFMENATEKHMLHELFEMSNGSSVRFVPITGPYRGVGYQSATKIASAGLGEVGLRINVQDFSSSQAKKEISDFVDGYDYKFEQIHLIIDAGYRQDIYSCKGIISSYVPFIDRWKSLILTSGAFPLDLREFEVGIQDSMRYDWLSWSRELSNFKINGIRVPTYSDYTIQHPRFSEPPKFANPSASIRYAVEDRWLVFRGEGLRTSDTGHDQYIGQAILLNDHEEFYGGEYSYGDEYVSTIARDQEKPGNPETWLRAGINHHITLTANQVSSLAG